MKVNKNILVIIGLIIVIILLLAFWPKKTNTTQTVTKYNTNTKIVRDTTVVVKKVDKFLPNSIQYVPVLGPVDTLAIIKDYNAKKTYDRVLIDNASAKVEIKDTVTQNGLQGSTVSFTNRTPTQIITNVHRGGLYLGINTNFQNIIPMITWSGNKLMIGGGYDFTSKTPELSIGFRLFK